MNTRGEIGALVAAVSLGGVIFAVHGSGQSSSTVRGPVGSDRAAARALAPSAFESAQRSAPARPERQAIEQHRRVVQQRRAEHRRPVVRHRVARHAAPRRAAPAPLVRAAPVVAPRPAPVVVAPRPRPVIRPVVRPAPRPVIRRPVPRPAPKPKPRPAPGVSFVDTG